MFEPFIEFAQNVILGLLWVAGGTAIGIGVVAAVKGVAAAASWAIEKLEK
uniref:Uncharacterized protein n=1 Tax=viral metagenome TaxID=1070528 RepID=A0A6H1ZKC3_9ZZZZ